MPAHDCSELTSMPTTTRRPFSATSWPDVQAPTRSRTSGGSRTDGLSMRISSRPWPCPLALPAPLPADARVTQGPDKRLPTRLAIPRSIQCDEKIQSLTVRPHDTADAEPGRAHDFRAAAVLCAHGLVALAERARQKGRVLSNDEAAAPAHQVEDIASRQGRRLELEGDRGLSVHDHQDDPFGDKRVFHDDDDAVLVRRAAPAAAVPLVAEFLRQLIPLIRRRRRRHRYKTSQRQDDRPPSGTHRNLRRAHLSRRYRPSARRKSPRQACAPAN